MDALIALGFISRVRLADIARDLAVNYWVLFQRVLDMAYNKTGVLFQRTGGIMQRVWIDFGRSQKQSCLEAILFAILVELL